MADTALADPIDEALLETLVGIALEAGRVVLEVYKDGANAEIKGDGSPVTVADRRAEAIILTGLRAVAPGVPIIAEEEASAGRTPPTPGDFFLVDPLDGTKEFLRGPSGGGEFTVNIAFVRNGAPITGVVYAPAVGRLWAARPGAAWTAQASPSEGVDEKRPVTVRTPPAAGLTAIASRSHATPETDSFLDRYEVAERRSAGSSLKFCLVAEGAADIYPRLGRTMEWDTAAGDAVLRAAGGRTVTLDGAALRYGKRDRPGDADFANPHFIALGGADLRIEA